MTNWIRLLESWAWRCCCCTRFGADGGVGVVGVVDDDDCSGLTDDVESAALTTLLVNTVSADEFSTLVDDGLLVADSSPLFVSEFGLLF